MRPIPQGYQATLEVLVTPEMTVHFEELGRLHPVYATYWMAKHFEEAGRKIILPFLEEGENGLGSAVSVDHRASALPGMRVTITATLERVEGRRIYASMTAVNELGDLIGTGSTVQVALPQERIDRGFRDLEARFRAHREERV
ncbi:putative thioesterase [Deinobacterium chartae]|uniref:Putative thioesterase n=1 Tax=Deinobacterium chartae TaxID=521158 RepID=A0A841HXE6_9DEIO|nr:thioesterase family protein [Deinobacterium chartae]MBB6098201.1 putative thioesterase [Deinobacterium chartae]